MNFNKKRLYKQKNIISILLFTYLLIFIGKIVRKRSSLVVALDYNEWMMFHSSGLIHGNIDAK